ncbi:vomeronasal type-2 receptor 1-like [Protopterus annectens]|uniref:vomeronasal type-2 receptor 1-like n=1 Tax=Protopterus annectens TaxID=7888 RepID=UPI001CFB0597|nr:vomeronasal type-2 receptor 1-like [Protopterus annectens]
MGSRSRTIILGEDPMENIGLLTQLLQQLSREATQDNNGSRNPNLSIDTSIPLGQGSNSGQTQPEVIKLIVTPIVSKLAYFHFTDTDSGEHLYCWMGQGENVLSFFRMLVKSLLSLFSPEAVRQFLKLLKLSDFIEYLVNSVISAEADTTCKLLGKFNLPSLYMSGDIVIGGLFNIHTIPVVQDVTYKREPEITFCEGFNFRSLRWARTLAFAVDEINNNAVFLSNISLGYRIHDSCGKHPMSLRATFVLVNGQKEVVPKYNCHGFGDVSVLVGDPSSSQSMIISRTLGPYHVPLVSYFSTCSCLSSKSQFPAFLRTIPSDQFQARAMAHLVKHFQWTWVGILASDDDYGINGIQKFTEEINANEFCISFFEKIPKIYSEKKTLQIVDTLKQFVSAKVIVAFAGEQDIYTILQELQKQNITDRQFIASEAWSTSTITSTRDLYYVTAGTLGFAISKALLPGLQAFLYDTRPSQFPGNAFVKEFWELSFGCKFLLGNFSVSASSQICTGSEDFMHIKNAFPDVSQLRVSYNVYKAAYAIAHALHNLQLCDIRNGPFKNRSCADMLNLHPYQLFHYLKEVRFTSTNGDYFDFDENGDPIPEYDIVNWQINEHGSVEYVSVGYVKDTEIRIEERAIVWKNSKNKAPMSMCSESCLPGTRKRERKGEPVCCFDCVSCSEGEISNQTDAIKCLKCAENFWPNDNRNVCISKIIEFLSFEDTLGVILTSAALSGTCMTFAVWTLLVYYRHTPIVRANNSEISFLLLFALFLCFLCALVFIGRPTHWSCMLRHTAFGISFALCISCILAKTLVVIIAFKATLPGNSIMKWFGAAQQRGTIFSSTAIQTVICVVWLIMSPPLPTKNPRQQSMKIIFECDIGSVTAFSFVLGYIGLLASICFVLAFLARRLPDNFNEAKFITFSMLIFCAVWITFIPAYISSPGKYTVGVEIFAILVSSFSILGCIFAPKCYIILLKPQQNTKKAMMGKQ